MLVNLLMYKSQFLIQIDWIGFILIFIYFTMFFDKIPVRFTEKMISELIHFYYLYNDCHNLYND